jgi:uncharacterized membrane protein
VHKKSYSLVSFAIGLVTLTLFFSFFQASSFDFVREHRILVYTASLVLRILSFLAACIVLFIFLRRGKKRADKVKHLILIFLLILLAAQTSLFYAAVLKDSNNSHCLNTVRLHGVAGDICWLPD